MALTDAEKEQERLFLQELQNRSTEAWDLVENYVIKAFLKKHQNFRSMANDFQLDSQTLRSMLFAEMIGNNKLEKYGYRSRVVYWMQYYVKKIISEYCEKNPLPVSDEDSSEVFIDRDNNKDLWEVVEVSFSKLWKENPMKAYVYQLKMYHKLSSKEVASMLGLQSANVDQIFKRAKDDMLELLEAMGGAA